MSPRAKPITSLQLVSFYVTPIFHIQSMMDKMKSFPSFTLIEYFRLAQ